MNSVKLGEFQGPEQKRDAVHIAVIPAIAGQHLTPGCRVVMEDGLAVLSKSIGSAIGIADPFMPRETIPNGARFLVLLFPDTIVSIRHEWEHPSFPLSTPPDAEAKERAKSYLKTALENTAWDGEHPPDFDEFISQVVKERSYEFYGTSYYYETDKEEFWSNLSTYLGYPITSNEVNFSCTC